MNVFFYGLNFMHIKDNFTGQPIFLKKMMEEFKNRGHDIYYLYRNNVTDMETFGELKIRAKYLPLKSNVEFHYEEYIKYSNKELNSIIDFDVQKLKVLRNKDNSKVFKHNVLKILENLREYDEKYNIDMLVVWGAGYIPRAISYYAKKNNKKLVVMENGYFRPYTLMVDAVGVNFENSVPRERSFYENLVIDDNRFNKYLNKPEYAEIDDTLSKQFHSKNQVNEKKVHVGKSDQSLSIKGNYVFVPFQLQTDSQIISHSKRIKEMKDLVLYCLTAVINYNKANNSKIKVVFKIHPHYKNDGDNFDLSGIRAICKAYQEHCLLLEEGDTTELVKNAKMIITINSTVGIEGLMHSKNVITLGDAFYNIDGVVKNITPYNLITHFKSLISRKPNKELIKKFLYFLRFNYFVETYYPDADTKSIRNLVTKMLEINPTFNYKSNKMYYKNMFLGTESRKLSCNVNEIRFTRAGNITVQIKTNIRDDISYNDLNFYLENNENEIKINLKPKEIDYKNNIVTLSILSKQIFYKHNKIDEGNWELYASDQEHKLKLEWEKEEPLSNKLLINGLLYDVVISSSSIQFNVNVNKDEVEKYKVIDNENWNKFSSTYLDLNGPFPSKILKNKLNILYMPWIERSTNSHINIIDERTEINFIPFKYYRNVNDSQFRSKINVYTRENKDRVKKHMKQHITKYYKDVDAVIVTLDWITPINIFVEACNELNIPTFLVPHESVFAKMDMYYVDVVTGIDCPVTNYILAWGDIQKDIYVSRGFDSTNIINVGTPKFDVNKNYQVKIDKHTFFKNINFDINKKTILFVMQPLDSQYNESDARDAQNKIIRDLMKISQKFDYQLILRLPPALGEKLIDNNLLDKIKNSNYIYLEGLENEPLVPQDSILHSDILLSINSTMLFEAALLDKPSLAIKYIEFDLFWEKAGLPSVNNYLDLEAAIVKLISTDKNSLTYEGWKWASQQLSDGEFTLDASEKIEKNIHHLLKHNIGDKSNS